MRKDVCCEIEIQLTNRDIDVVRIDTEVGMEAKVGLFESLAVRGLQWNCFEEDDHDEVQAPDFVRLSQAVDAPHFALLVRIGEDAGNGLLAGDPIHEVLPALLCDVLPQFAQQSRGPFLLDVDLLVLWMRTTGRQTRTRIQSDTRRGSTRGAKRDDDWRAFRLSFSETSADDIRSNVTDWHSLSRHRDSGPKSRQTLPIRVLGQRYRHLCSPHSRSQEYPQTDANDSRHAQESNQG